MRLLLDTHTFLWFTADDPQLSRDAARLIGDPANERFLSMASVWEMAIKISLRKLVLTQTLDIFLAGQLPVNRIQILPITQEHAVCVSTLPFSPLAGNKAHKDPFDRLIVAQGLVEAMQIVTIEAFFTSYGVTTLW